MDSKDNQIPKSPHRLEQIRADLETAIADLREKVANLESDVRVLRELSNTPHESITCRYLKVVDQRGIPLIELGASSDGNAILRLRTQGHTHNFENASKAELRLCSDGFWLFDSAGRERISGHTAPSAEPDVNGDDAFLCIADRYERERVRLHAGANNNSSIVISDANGTVRIGAGTDSDRNAGVLCYDSNSKLRIDTTVCADGEAWVRCHDTSGKLRISTTTFPDGDACAQWFDKHEKLRVDTSTCDDGWAGTEWWDAAEKPCIVSATRADGSVILPVTSPTPDP